MRGVGGKVEEESARCELRTVVQIAFDAEEVAHFPGIGTVCCDRGAISVRQIDVALTGMRSQVNDD